MRGFGNGPFCWIDGMREALDARHALNSAGWASILITMHDTDQMHAALDADHCHD